MTRSEIQTVALVILIELHHLILGWAELDRTHISLVEISFTVIVKDLHAFCIVSGWLLSSWLGQASIIRCSGPGCIIQDALQRNWASRHIQIFTFCISGVARPTCSSLAPTATYWLLRRHILHRWSITCLLVFVAHIVRNDGVLGLKLMHVTRYLAWLSQFSYACILLNTGQFTRLAGSDHGCVVVWHIWNWLWLLWLARLHARAFWL